jgi:hypothetical protein
VLVLTNPNTSANVQTITVRNLTTYLPIANSTVPGVIKIGPGLSVAANGTVTAPLPVASGDVTGVVKIGSGINVDANGVISVSGGGSANTGNIRFNEDVIYTNSGETIFINNPNNAIQIGGQWLVQMSATSNAESLWGSGNTQSYAWVYQDPNYSNGYAEFGTYVSGDTGENHYAEMFVTSNTENMFFIGHNDGVNYKRLTYSANCVFNLPEGGDYRINGVSIVGTGEIDGGNAFTSPTAEITVDGGGA